MRGEIVGFTHGGQWQRGVVTSVDPVRKRYEVFVPDNFASVSGRWEKGAFSRRTPIAGGVSHVGGRRITLSESELRLTPQQKSSAPYDWLKVDIWSRGNVLLIRTEKTQIFTEFSKRVMHMHHQHICIHHVHQYTGIIVNMKLKCRCEFPLEKLWANCNRTRIP